MRDAARGTSSLALHSGTVELDDGTVVVDPLAYVGLAADSTAPAATPVG